MSKAATVMERPILMSAPMVKAILGGRKTQTRRVVKPQPETYAGESGLQFEWPGWHGSLGAKSFARYCPYGQPGERLWVRETFARRLDVDPAVEPEKARHYALYRANGTSLDEPHWHSYADRWTPAIHMPRWASRLTLELTAVRVERLQAISEEDAIAEGVDEISIADVPRQASWSRRQDFAQLWDKINGKRPGCAWADDPWTWVLEFRRLDPA